MKKARLANHVIVGIHVTDRARHAAQVQGVLTAFGAQIKTRLGLHEAGGRKPSPSGIILLEMVGDEKRCLAILGKLNAIGGVEAKPMVFGH